jgi:hypothetical protein
MRSYTYAEMLHQPIGMKVFTKYLHAKIQNIPATHLVENEKPRFCGVS